MPFLFVLMKDMHTEQFEFFKTIFNLFIVNVEVHVGSHLTYLNYELVISGINTFAS